MRARSRTLSATRLVCVVGLLATLGLTVWGPGREPAGLAFVALLVAFVVLLRMHDRVLREERSREIGERYAEWGLRRLAGTWHDDGNQIVESDGTHPFAQDLDLEGRRSLRAFLDTTATAFGRATLGARLAAVKNPAFERVVSWQKAAAELGERSPLRETLFTRGTEAREADPLPMLAWAEGTSLAASGAVRLVAFALPAATLGLLLAAPFIGPYWFAIPLVVQIAFAKATVPNAAEFVAKLTHGERGIAPFSSMMAAIEGETFQAEELVRLRGVLSEKGRASVALSRLARIVSFAEARENEVFRLFIGPLFLWDVHSALRLEAWRASFGPGLRAWLEALGEFEALSAVGTFTFDHDELTFPTFSEKPRLFAKGLGHPLLPKERRICNDVPELGAGEALVVTGSNMSGKSTMLRTIGTSIVLAYAGAPVVAREMVVGPGAVKTSMRIADSLDEGISHFLAELLRLRGILERARAGEHVIFLLDEILHGTNHRERLIGAKLVIRDLLAKGALGLVSTHDLGVGELETETGGRAKNVHFEEQVESGKMTFDYRMRDGLVASSNALRLMADLGIVPKDALSS